MVFCRSTKVSTKQNREKQVRAAVVIRSPTEDETLGADRRSGGGDQRVHRRNHQEQEPRQRIDVVVSEKRQRDKIDPIDLDRRSRVNGEPIFALAP